MTQESMNDHEMVSALADGQLRRDEFVRAVNLLESSSEHRSTWHAYHSIGDMMRTGACPAIESDNAFLQRLRLNLEQEPLPAKNDATVATPGADSGVETPGGAMPPASNDSLFRWKAWGGIASVVAISFVAGQWFTGVDERGLAQLAQSRVSTQTLAQSERGDPLVMIRDPQLDALLAAHQQLGGTSAFQNPTGFVRSATFTGTDR